MADVTIWGIHAGRYGDADKLFLKGKVIALGWPQMEDLSGYHTREDFKAAYQALHPDFSTMKVAAAAGQLFRFVREIQGGDLVVYPSQWDREVHIGKVTGDYSYIQDDKVEFPNRRQVEWLKSAPRTAFSQGALYEMGSAMSLFQIKTYAEEVLGILEGAQPISVAEDEEVSALVAGDIEQQTRDFVLKQLAHKLKGHPFAEFVAHLLQAMGYRTRLSPPGPDHQIDIVAHMDDLGFTPPIVKVEVKSGDGTAGEPVVSALYGRVSTGEFGLIVSLGGFSTQARAFALTKGNLRLLDGNDVVDLLYQHYDQLDPKYKGIIPLRKVYVPESVGADS